MTSDEICLPPQVRQLVDYTQSVLEAKVAAYDTRQQSADLAIISNLDRDGNGFIDLSEFVGLSKYTGFSKVCAARQGRDHGSDGSLMASDVSSDVFLCGVASDVASDFASDLASVIDRH